MKTPLKIIFLSIALFSSQWLLADITIQTAIPVSACSDSSGSFTGTNCQVQESAIEDYLNTGTDVTISTSVGESLIVNGDVSINKTSGSDATLSLESADNVTLLTGSQVVATTGALNVILWSRTDDGVGNIEARGIITTNAGHLWMGGGAATAVWNSLSVGDGIALTLAENYAVWQSPISVDSQLRFFLNKITYYYGSSVISVGKMR